VLGKEQLRFWVSRLVVTLL